MEENVIQINVRVTINVDVSLKNVMYFHSCENGKYLASIMDDSGITCDEIIESYNEETKTISTNFDKKSNL